MDVDKMTLDQVLEYIRRQANTIELQTDEIKRLESYVLALRRELSNVSQDVDAE